MADHDPHESYGPTEHELQEAIAISRAEITRLDSIVTQFLQAIRPSKPVLHPENVNAIVDGVSYCFQKAASLGLPCVVNLSLSSQFGPHDGSGGFSQMIGSLSGPHSERAWLSPSTTCGGLANAFGPIHSKQNSASREMRLKHSPANIQFPIKENSVLSGSDQ